MTTIRTRQRGMRGRRRRLAACAAVAMVAGLGVADVPVSPVGAQDAIRSRQVTITALPTLTEGDYAVPAEVNDLGVVTVTSAPGYAAGLEPGAQAYLWRDGQVATLVPPGAEGSSAVNITDTGLVSGSALRDGVAYPFLWRVGRFTDVGVPVDPSSRLSLSERGHLSVSDPGNPGVWWRGRYTPIEAPAGVRPAPVMVNNRGTAVGWFMDVTSGTLRLGGFTWSEGVFTDIAPGNAAQHALLDVNDRGQVVGVCNHRACMIDDGVTIDLGTLGGSSSLLGPLGGISRNVLNERGQVAGHSAVAESNDRHAFLWEDGEMRDLGTLGGGSSEALALNEKGHVVGKSQTASGEWHAFYWADGVMTDLGTLGGANSEAYALNDHGRIVGRADTPAGVSQGVVWDVR